MQRILYLPRVLNVESRFWKTWRVHEPIQNITGRYDPAKQESFGGHYQVAVGVSSSTSGSESCLASDRLLDASGNDGDRGILIASFSEALISEGNPQECITLLDRLVDDFDNLFDGIALFPSRKP